MASLPEDSGRRKVMAVGLDGLTLDLLLPLARSGALPTFARLLGQGQYGILHSVTNTATGPTWASFATGCEPPRHGNLHDFHHVTGRYGLRPTNGADRRGVSFWEAASDAGRNVVVLNVPHTYPVRPVRGVILAGIDAPSQDAPGFDHPPGSARALRRHIGEYVVDCGAQSYFQAKEAAQGTGAMDLAVAAVERETEARTRAAEHYLRRVDWDLLVVVYSLPDIWQHHFWADLERPGSAGEATIESGYRLVDAHLGRLLAHLPEDGLAVVFSDHGFGPLCGTRDDLNRWLAEQNLLAFHAGRADGVARRWLGGALAQVRRHSSYNRRQRLLASVPALRRAVDTRLRMGGIDWRRTKAYAAIDHNELWLNVRGRQPAGTVAPEDQEALAQQLAASLLGWRDEDGRPLVAAVHRQPYAGVELPGVLPPDLALEWDPDAARAGLHPAMSGDHTLDGTLVVSGAGVGPGRLAPSRLVDVAPLVLAGLGLPAFGMDGGVPSGLRDAVGPRAVVGA